jgi:hypothetical protein
VTIEKGEDYGDLLGKDNAKADKYMLRHKIDLYYG